MLPLQPLRSSERRTREGGLLGGVAVTDGACCAALPSAAGACYRLHAAWPSSLAVGMPWHPGARSTLLVWTTTMHSSSRHNACLGALGPWGWPLPCVATPAAVAAQKKRVTAQQERRTAASVANWLVCFKLNWKGQAAISGVGLPNWDRKLCSV